MVRFVEMDDAKTVQERIACFFFYHSIYHLFPSLETVSIFDCAFDKPVLDEPIVDASLFCTIMNSRFDVGVNTMRLKKSMLVAEVSS